MTEKQCLNAVARKAGITNQQAKKAVGEFSDLVAKALENTTLLKFPGGSINASKEPK